MSRKPKAASYAITIEPSSVLAFGGHVDYVVSPALSMASGTQTLLTVVDTTGWLLEKGYSSAFPGGDASLALGPTPSWSSGGGTATLEVVTYDKATGKFNPTGSSVSFEVAP
jgi:hypothetical protein